MVYGDTRPSIQVQRPLELGQGQQSPLALVFQPALDARHELQIAEHGHPQSVCPFLELPGVFELLSELLGHSRGSFDSSSPAMIVEALSTAPIAAWKSLP